MEKFLVTFGDTQEVYTEEQLVNFIKVAVLKNKDINNFSVNRLEVIDVDVNEYGEVQAQYDLKEYENNTPNCDITSLVISELSDYALNTNVDNVIEKLDKVKFMTETIKCPVIRDQFEISALRIINSKV